jgi:hypothetical protein
MYLSLVRLNGFIFCFTLWADSLSLRYKDSCLCRLAGASSVLSLRAFSAVFQCARFLHELVFCSASTGRFLATFLRSRFLQLIYAPFWLAGSVDSLPSVFPRSRRLLC